MSLKQELINSLPPFINDWQVIKKKQGTEDIISEVQEAHRLFEADYDLIYQFFDTGNIETTCRKLWEFQRNELDYEAETGKDQSSRNPSAILALPDDCKHYALFSSGVLSAIQRHRSVPWDWIYRFVSDTEPNYVTHVFVVVEDGSKEYWIDPCLGAFDRRKKYLITQDYTDMLYRITGISDIAADTSKTVTVDPKKAFTSFLIMLQQNLFPEKLGGISMIKELMRGNPQITNGPVKQWFISQGYDWSQVMQFVNE